MGFKINVSHRGEEISLKMHQINAKVIKEGNKKFTELTKKEESGEEKPAEAPSTQ